MGTPINTAPASMPMAPGSSTVEISLRLDAPAWVLIEEMEVISLNRIVNGVDTCVIRMRGGRYRYPTDPSGQPILFKPNIIMGTTFVRVQLFDPDSNDLVVWYGYVVAEQEFRGGKTELTSDRIYNAVGVEFFLGREQITQAQMKGGFGFFTIERPLAFNSGNDDSPFKAQFGSRGNKDSGNLRFHDDPTVPPSLWSGKEILQYLIQFETPALPVASWGLNAARDEAESLSRIHPMIRTEGRTFLHILNELCGIKRGQCWWVDYDNNLNSAIIRINTFAAAEYTSLTVNFSKKDIDFDLDKSVVFARIGDNYTRQYHQVVARGARRTSVGSLSVEDGTLEPLWRSIAEAEYKDAVNGSRAANDEFRKSAKYDAVYQHFAMPGTWLGQVGNGIGGGLNFLFPETQVSAGITTLTGSYDRTSQTGMSLRSKMPLEKGYDYSTSYAAPDGMTTVNVVGASAKNLGENADMQGIMCFMRIAEPAGGGYDPANEQWQHANQLRDTKVLRGNRIFALRDDYDNYSVGKLDSVAGVRINSSALNHAHAKDHFSKATNKSDVHAQVRYEETIVTAAFESDSYAEAKFPLTAAPPAGMMAQTIVIDCGDSYRFDYMAPGTVVHLASGNLVHAAGGVLRNDLPELEALAEVAYRWYQTPQREMSVRFRGLRNWKAGLVGVITTGLELGDMIENVGTGLDQVVANTVITSILYDVDAQHTTITTGLADAPPLPE